ncbi:MAG TPA: PhoH family protein [Candidatus Desulfofervidus auxilii]|uniref:PhoH-like protein n=1 Tax=Desulfofervidus auxilii TaxID=1621989 RepID=A0A7V0NEA8_DESA2|nr:PhoH family protein [Candidatus Desulfofervidus auxilii]
MIYFIRVRENPFFIKKEVLKLALPAKERYTITKVFENIGTMRNLCGERNFNLQIIEKNLGIKLNLRGNRLLIEGERLDVELADNLLGQLYELVQRGYPVYPSDIEYAIRLLQSDAHAQLKDIFLDTVYIVSRRRVITPKTKAQKEYIDAIRRYDIVFGIGPAGTGKTYLAMAMAISALMRGEVTRIILTRPAVEAGEKLGFLPGDLYEKVNPYLRPLYDALHDMLDFDRTTKLLQKGVIEIAPLAFMRGRTLNDAFVILDEAQNTTSEQMKMFLTRLGYNARAVVTGDITQIDLPQGVASGLIEAKEILEGIEGIKFIYFDKTDVIRHRLVREIIRAYEELEEEKTKRHARARRDYKKE